MMEHLFFNHVYRQNWHLVQSLHIHHTLAVFKKSTIQYDTSSSLLLLQIFILFSGESSDIDGFVIPFVGQEIIQGAFIDLQRNWYGNDFVMELQPSYRN